MNIIENSDGKSSLKLKYHLKSNYMNMNNSRSNTMLDPISMNYEYDINNSKQIRNCYSQE